MTATTGSVTGAPVGAPARGRLTLGGIRKTLGGREVVRGIDLQTEPGEFLTLLGPSGCGKTTTLNIVAGHLLPDAGSVQVDGRELTTVPANRRAMGMVFQSYALFPHMTVADNVGFGLRMRRTAAAERRRKVTEALEMVGLDGMEGRHPRQLSGGQQQRAALARALVVEPDLLLLDEPFSNLDAQLRVRLRDEVVALQRRIGTTAILVTHDQEEALAVSDRIAVMNEGTIHQIADPQTVYLRPATDFVATFVGEVNVLDGVATAGGCRLPDGHVIAATAVGAAPADGAPARVYVRPEAVQFGTDGIAGRVTSTRFLGTRVRCHVETAAGQLEVTVPFAAAVPGTGEEVRCTWPSQHASLVARSG
ncbi:ABC transporter ATP-binding protein [Pseudonocardia adelaidensis]|uniref:ABC transporter ATP-binding protein n=1 Tax=Pseudonocardia adelaidensis TaxID=648754 RepID=A0ABP9NJH9_9PSEU